MSSTPEELKEEINALTWQLQESRDENDELDDEISRLESIIEGNLPPKTEELIGLLLGELKNLLPQVKEKMHSHQWSQVQSDYKMVETLVEDLRREGVGQ